MADGGQVKIKCIIQKADTQGPPYKKLELVHDSDVLSEFLIHQIRREHELYGEITVHKAIAATPPSRNMRHHAKIDSWIAGEEITGHRLNLTEGETIFLVWNDKVDVIPGGVGTGAEGLGLAMGGVGTGAQSTELHGRIAGDGLGGSLVAKDAKGKAGSGEGGTVKNGKAGGGVGGKVVKRDPKGSSAGQGAK